MGKITDAGLVLEGPELEDARRIINWGVRWSAGFLDSSEITFTNFGPWLEDLAARSRVAELLGEAGEPTFGGPGVALEPDDLGVVVAAAELLADWSAHSEDELDNPAFAPYREEQLATAWRVLLVLQPPEPTPPPAWAP